MRLAVDTGGTFTDLVVETDSGEFRLYKTATLTTDPARGVLEVLRIAARENDIDLADLLGQAEVLIHGTTRGLNAIVTGAHAKTAFVTTRGHRDILLFREGGRTQPFNNSRPYPAPYVPRRLTFEVSERIAADGRILVTLDESDALRVVDALAESGVEAVGVCFLWSIVNPTHERRFGELLETHTPEVAYTLSHELNPIPREYRRASATCIDASLKPVMSQYLTELARSLEQAGFGGRLLIVTSAGGVLDVDDVVQAPIHSLRSGPAMAPVAGRYYAQVEASCDSAIVADAGGTTYDVSLVRRGRIPWTREGWIGDESTGHITGFPSIDVKSIGAGGGSIAWVDAGGLLRVGPESAGSDPGPACYARGSERPTVTDASLLLGYLDAERFLGGRMVLDRDAAERALARHVARPLDVDSLAGAAAVLEVMTEQMVHAIEEITVRQGIAPAEAVLVAGGGASGFNCVALARRLGCPAVLVPDVAAGLSAAGGLLSDVIWEARRTFPTSTADFDHPGVNRVLGELAEQCARFIRANGRGAVESWVNFSAEARYPDQVWELEVPLRGAAFVSSEDVEVLRGDFHSLHRETFAVADEESLVEIVTWGARASCRLWQPPRTNGTLSALTAAHSKLRSRSAYFGGDLIEAEVHDLATLAPGTVINGPAIIESAASTVVVPPGAALWPTTSRSLRISPWAREPAPVDA